MQEIPQLAFIIELIEYLKQQTDTLNSICTVCILIGSFFHLQFDRLLGFLIFTVMCMYSFLLSFIGLKLESEA